jgi:exodeoxyribonuclease VII small subunit
MADPTEPKTPSLENPGPDAANADAPIGASLDRAPIDVGDIGYAEALAELESILGDLEDETIDIDVLAEQVARASALIQFCRVRISSARIQVDRIVAELEQAVDDNGQTSLL